MKSILFTFLLLTASGANASTSSLVETLESSLSFKGYVEIEKVTEIGVYTVVDFYVGAYGEERLTSCVLKNDKLVDCKDNWFKL